MAIPPAANYIINGKEITGYTWVHGVCPTYQELCGRSIVEAMVNINNLEATANQAITEWNKYIYIIENGKTELLNISIGTWPVLNTLDGSATATKNITDLREALETIIPFFYEINKEAGTELGGDTGVKWTMSSIYNAANITDPHGQGTWYHTSLDYEPRYDIDIEEIYKIIDLLLNSYSNKSIAKENIERWETVVTGIVLENIHEGYNSRRYSIIDIEADTGHWGIGFDGVEPPTKIEIVNEENHKLRTEIRCSNNGENHSFFKLTSADTIIFRSYYMYTKEGVLTYVEGGHWTYEDDHWIWVGPNHEIRNETMIGTELCKSLNVRCDLSMEIVNSRGEIFGAPSRQQDKANVYIEFRKGDDFSTFYYLRVYYVWYDAYHPNSSIPGYFFQNYHHEKGRLMVYIPVNPKAHDNFVIDNGFHRNIMGDILSIVPKEVWNNWEGSSGEPFSCCNFSVNLQFSSASQPGSPKAPDYNVELDNIGFTTQIHEKWDPTVLGYYKYEGEGGQEILDEDIKGNSGKWFTILPWVTSKISYIKAINKGTEENPQNWFRLYAKGFDGNPNITVWKPSLFPNQIENNFVGTPITNNTLFSCDLNIESKYPSSSFLGGELFFTLVNQYPTSYYIDPTKIIELHIPLHGVYNNYDFETGDNTLTVYKSLNIGLGYRYIDFNVYDIIKEAYPNFLTWLGDNLLYLFTMKIGLQGVPYQQGDESSYYQLDIDNISFFGN